MNLRTAPATIALGALGLLVIGGLGWLFVLGPTLGTLSDTQAERTDIEDRTTTLSVQLGSLRRLADDLPDLRKQADELEGVFPSTADQPGFFRAVNTAAEDAGLSASDIAAVSPGVPLLPEGVPAPAASTDGADAEVPAATLATQAVGITVNGSYDQLQDVLANLESMDRAILVTSAAVASGEDAFTLTVTGTTFVAPPLGDPPAASS